MMGMRRLFKKDFSKLQRLVESMNGSSCLLSTYPKDLIKESLDDDHTAWYADSKGYVRFVETRTRRADYDGVSFSAWLFDLNRGEPWKAHIEEALGLHANYSSSPIVIPASRSIIRRLGMSPTAPVVSLRVASPEVPITYYKGLDSSVERFYVLHEGSGFD